MSKAPPSPSFRPPKNDRLKGTMPRLAALSLSDPPTDSTSAPAPALELPSKDEISPVNQLGPTIVEPEGSNSLHPEQSNRRNSYSSENKRRNSQTFPDDDIYALDDEGWSRVANAGGIEEMLRLGEGISGSVSKCRLRKSGQVFAIKVISVPSQSLFIYLYLVSSFRQLTVDDYHRVFIPRTFIARIKIQSIL